MSPTPFWIPIHAAADEWLSREASEAREGSIGLLNWVGVRGQGQNRET